MKKLLLSAMLSSVMVLMAATMASAATQPFYHGNFATDTTGCAKCHVTHAATAARLLVSGTNQTEFCNYCHNDVTKAPYDSNQGMIDANGGMMPSLAGGFTKTFDFDTKAYNTTDGAALGNYLATTSKHGVESYDSDDWVTGVKIPGGANNLSGDFRCGSCHDPHAGGTYTAGTNMPRLLRTDLPVAINKATFDAWTFTAIGDSPNGFQTKVLTGYGDNAGTWCAGCHDVFNQTAHDAGTALVNNPGASITNKYMHRMNFTLAADGQTALGADNVLNKVPLSTGGALTCFTCHRAHGTASAVADGNLSFNRASTYADSLAGALTTSTSKSTVLLRLKNRDVCYKCHKEATANTPTLQGS